MPSCAWLPILTATLLLALPAIPQTTPKQVPPSDLFASTSYPDDLVSDLQADDGTDDCWVDELDGKNFDWDKSPDHPYVKYSYRFRNTCKKTMTCTLVVASGNVLRDPTQRKGSWKPFLADRRSFTVKPGEAAEISGTLKWAATDLRMPSIRDSTMPCWFGD